MTLGKGRAEAITDDDFAVLADSLGAHPAVLEAIANVESQGFGWFSDGRMKILFEKHWFFKLASADVLEQALREGLARAKWISPGKGGYREQRSSGQRYDILASAIDLDEEAAYRSISMGRFQIMGFNYTACGYQSAREMFDSFVDSEVNQLGAFAAYLEHAKLLSALKSRDFATIEKRYNGGGLNGEYARRMKVEYDKLRGAKWLGYVPGSNVPTTRLDRPPTSSRPEKSAGGLAGLIARLLGVIFGAFSKKSRDGRNG